MKTLLVYTLGVSCRLMTVSCMWLLLLTGMCNYAQKVADTTTFQKKKGVQKEWLNNTFEKAEDLIAENEVAEAKILYDQAFKTLKKVAHTQESVTQILLIEQFYSTVLNDNDYARYIVEILQKKSMIHQDPLGQIKAYFKLGNIDSRELKYISSLKNYNKALRLAEQQNDTDLIWEILIDRGDLLLDIGDLDQAKKDFKRALNHINKEDTRGRKRHTYVNISASIPDEQPDSIKYYSRLALIGCKGKKDNLICTIAYNNLAWAYYLKKMPKAAKDVINNCIGLKNEYNTDSFEHGLRSGMLHTLGVAEYDLKNYKAALKYLKLSEQSYSKSSEISNLILVKDDLSKVYEIVGELSESIRLHKEIQALEKSQLRVKMIKEVAKSETKKILIAKEKEISGLEQKNVYIQKQVSQTKWLSYGLGVLLCTAIGILLYRGYRSRIKYYQINQQLVLSRLTSLRMSMNPHFLFNTFSTLQNYILKKDNLKANCYMTELSGLIRNVLNSSDSIYIDLATELDILKSYVSLQRGRFQEGFDVMFRVSPALVQMNPQIPSMMIQPFIENAILHGFSNLKTKGELKIILEQNNNTVTCAVVDNGIGRKASEELKNKATENAHLSIATKNTNERLNILNKTIKEKSSVIINDLMDAKQQSVGTEVVITLPIIKEVIKNG